MQILFIYSSQTLELTLRDLWKSKAAGNSIQTSDVKQEILFFNSCPKYCIQELKSQFAFYACFLEKLLKIFSKLENNSEQGNNIDDKNKYIQLLEFFIILLQLQNMKQTIQSPPKKVEPVYDSEITIDQKQYTRMKTISANKQHPHRIYQNEQLNELLIIHNPNQNFYDKNLIYQREVHERIRYNQMRDSTLYPNIVNILKIIQQQDGDQILMQKGQEDLFTFLKRPEISFRMRLACLHGAALAIQQIHSLGIIHRDIKASNFIVKLIKDHYIVQIIDFDISFCKDSDYELDNQGTDDYKAPELLFNKITVPRDAYPKIDIWAFGILMFKTLLQVENHYFEDMDQGRINKIIEGCIDSYEIWAFQYPFTSILDLIKSILRVDYHQRPDIQNIINQIKNFFDTFPIVIAHSSDQIYKLNQIREGIFYDDYKNRFAFDIGSPYTVTIKDPYMDTNQLKQQLSTLPHIIHNNDIQFILEVLINLITIRYPKTSMICQYFFIPEQHQIHISAFDNHNLLVEQIQHNLVYHYLDNNSLLIDLIHTHWTYHDGVYEFLYKLVRLYTSLLPQYDALTHLLKDGNQYYYYTTLLDIPNGFECKVMLPCNIKSAMQENKVILMKYYLPANIQLCVRPETTDIHELLLITCTLIDVSQYLFLNKLMLSLVGSYKDYIIVYQNNDGIKKFAGTYKYIKPLTFDMKQVIDSVIHFMRYWARQIPQSTYTSFYDKEFQTFTECMTQLQKLISNCQAELSIDTKSQEGSSVSSKQKISNQEISMYSRQKVPQSIDPRYLVLQSQSTIMDPQINQQKSLKTVSNFNDPFESQFDDLIRTKEKIKQLEHQLLELRSRSSPKYSKPWRIAW